MTTRVTHRSIQESTMARLQGNLQAISKLQGQVSSGKKIAVPSDDPSGTVTALAVRQQVRLNEQYERAGQDGQSWLAVQDTALQTTSSQLRAARNLVVAALNTGTANDGTRTAQAVEVDGITATVKSLMNSQYLGRNVFAGTSGVGAAVVDTTTGSTTTHSFAATGTGTVTRQVDGASSVRVDSDGRQLFGDDSASGTYGQSVLTLLSNISAEIKTPGSTGTSLSTMLGQLDDRVGKVLEGLADVGARTNRIEQAQSVASSNKVVLAQQLSDAEDTDIPSAMVSLSLQSTAYQAALKANAKVLQISLMDFLN